MKYIVEVVVCTYNDEGERWHADGRIVGEFNGPIASQVVADVMVKAGMLERDILLAHTEEATPAPAGDSS